MSTAEQLHLKILLNLDFSFGLLLRKKKLDQAG